MEPGLGPGAAAPRALCRWGPWPLPHIPPGRGPGLLGPPGLGVCSGTCADCLPAHGERGPGLNDVHGDGAVVVRPGPPGELSRGVCNLIYGHSLGGTWRAWKSKTLRVGVHWLHTPWTGRLSPALVITEHPLGAGSSASPEPQAGGVWPCFLAEQGSREWSRHALVEVQRSDQHAHSATHVQPSGFCGSRPRVACPHCPLSVLPATPGSARGSQGRPGLKDEVPRTQTVALPALCAVQRSARAVAGRTGEPGPKWCANLLA